MKQQKPNWRYTFYEGKKVISVLELIDKPEQKLIDGLVELGKSARTGEITYKEEKINE